MSQPADPTSKGLLDNVQRDIITLANALATLNNYGPRIASVASACQSILAPSPDESRAQEDLAQLTAIRAKRGAIVSIVTDWDSEWHFLFQFRFSDGYWTGDGFDLRSDTPGFHALGKALDACKLDHSLCDLTAPEVAGPVPSRRIVFPTVVKTEEVK